VQPSCRGQRRASIGGIFGWTNEAGGFTVWQKVTGQADKALSDGQTVNCDAEEPDRTDRLGILGLVGIAAGAGALVIIVSYLSFGDRSQELRSRE
jgi:hypothetical protein